ncbi:hypothetical protein [Bacteroides sp.]|uniref:hypothetical protein n=1 Tax=Bacteroides sp. TaxID=29523 RepID=UPI0026359137|nr:hypothetical protein [Bacteroides sp.]MDD3041063.1 hypothetical protein [Bacteroides sp.]
MDTNTLCARRNVIHEETSICRELSLSTIIEEERIMAQHDQGTFEVVLKAATSLPFVRIDREGFLGKELIKSCPREQVQQAIVTNPARAGIDKKVIDGIANSCIKYELNKVSSISFAAGLPGGVAMLAAVPADVSQYFAHILRILQKLIYLYGWEELFDENGTLDDETTNMLTIFVGVMFGVNSATATLTKLSASAAKHATKSIATKAWNRQRKVQEIRQQNVRTFGNVMS